MDAKDYSAYDSMTTEELRQLLKEDLNAADRRQLPVDNILAICGIIEKRNAKRRIDVKAAFRRFKKYYCVDDPK